jgi:hypothetical protein
MFPGSSVVEQLTVNQLVASSNLARGAKFQTPNSIIYFFIHNNVELFLNSLKLLIYSNRYDVKRIQKPNQNSAGVLILHTSKINTYKCA